MIRPSASRSHGSLASMEAIEGERTCSGTLAASGGLEEKACDLGLAQFAEDLDDSLRIIG